MADILALVALGTWFLWVVLDFVAPARTFPGVRGWRIKGVLTFLFTIVYTTVLPFLWTDLFAAHSVLHLDRWGLGAGIAIGFGVYQLFAYAYHRAAHTIPALWRWTHQMHHSAERVDIWGATYFHPLDLLLYTLLQGIAQIWILGLSPEAVVGGGAIGLFYSLFQHANIRTPWWLGYVIQRPEAHSLHHERGVHAWNYADFPPIDMLFGTFRNPRTWEGHAGFADGDSGRILEMLIGRDIASGAEPPANPAPSEVR